ncbi:MAG: translation initiation factor IF-2 [Patescibacteria group bacterium]
MSARISKNTKNTLVERPPVVVVMGHIDHGKSTLLDYIRKTKIVDKEAGGITQHVSAYEAVYEVGGTDGIGGKKRRVTFLDTPGHEAFHTLRSRGAKIADVAILVVSVEDGVKPQTLEALNRIKEQDIPFVVAINKIDKPNTDINRAKQSLAENDIYVEGYGGTVSCVPISAKTGEGVPELLDVVFLASDLQEPKGDRNISAKGVVIESKLDSRKGITATLIIKDGTLRTGDFVVAGPSMATVRVMENDLGEKINEVSFSTPVTIAGWDELVPAGAEFQTFETKDDAVSCCKNFKENEAETARLAKSSSLAGRVKADADGAGSAVAENADGIGGAGSVSEIAVLPLIVKADTLGSLEAISYEIKKIKNARIQPKIISESIGAIGEGDVKLANGHKKAVILGFNTKADSPAKILAERDNIGIEIFSIIYKLTERVEELLRKQTPKMMVEEMTGSARILRTFSHQRDKQIIGGKVDEGFLAAGKTVKIIRRETEIGAGKIKGLQQQKKDVEEIKAGNEFGALVESKLEIAVGDVLRAFQTVEK